VTSFFSHETSKLPQKNKLRGFILLIFFVQFLKSININGYLSEIMMTNRLLPLWSRS